jgi:hypothetical protein
VKSIRSLSVVPSREWARLFETPAAQAVSPTLALSGQ